MAAIINVKENGTSWAVEYESGVIRNYKTLPVTATRWLESHKKAEVMEETTQEATQETTHETTQEMVTEVTEEALQLPAVQDPAPVAVIETETEEPEEETPKVSKVSKVAEAVVSGARVAAHVAVVLAKLAVMAGKASLPWVVKGAKALYSLALMVIYSSLDVADAIKTWAPFGAHKVQGWVVYSLIPGARKAARVTRRAGSVALEIIVAGSRQAAGIAIVAALVAVKAGAAMVQGATVVAGGCKAGWQMRQEIIDEEREAA